MNTQGKRQKMLAVVEETANFYNSKNRAMDKDNRETIGACMYTLKDNEGTKHCAVGRCMTEEAQDKVGDYLGDVGSVASDFADGNLDELLKPEYRGLNKFFWYDLQSLHDQKDNWNEEGLTNLGKESKEIIVLDINEGRFDY